MMVQSYEFLLGYSQSWDAFLDACDRLGFLVIHEASDGWKA